MGTPSQNSTESVFDKPYWGNLIRACFPEAKRIDEHWTRKTIIIHVSLAEWENASRLRYDADGFDFASWVRAFSGLPNQPPAAKHELKVSAGEADGFPEGERFVLLTISNVGFPDRRRMI